MLKNSLAGAVPPTATQKGASYLDATKPKLPSVNDLLTDQHTLDIFREYFPNFKKLKQIFSSDHSKRLNIFQHKGIYLVKDFAAKEFTEQKALNILQVIQEYHNCDFKEAHRLLAAKMGYIPNVAEVTPKRLSATPKRIITPDTEAELLQVDLKRWKMVISSHHSNFHQYARSQGVKEEHLRKWNVGTELRGNTAFTVFAHQDKQGKFTNFKYFKFSTNGSRIKDLQPFYLKNPEGKRYGQCLYGEHLLREGVPVVIVESEKTAVLGSFFYPQFDFIATGGVNGLSKKVNALAGKSGYVLHDADEAGRTLTTWKELKKNGLDFIPVELFPNKNCGYDLADAIRDGLRPNISDGQYQVKRVDYTLYVKQYCSEEAANFCDYLKTHKKVLLQAGTGSGKTTLALKDIVPYWPGRVIIVQPLTVIVDAIAKQEYGKAAVIKQGATDEDIRVAINSKLTVCTIDSFSRIDTQNDDDLIVGDEIHALHTLYSIPDKRTKYDYFFKRILEAKNVLLVSATPPDFYREYGFKRVVIKAGIFNKICIVPKVYKGKVQHQVVQALCTLNYNEKQCIVRLNSLDLIRRVMKAFKGLQPDQVAELSSDTKSIEGGVYQSIINTKMIPEHIRLILTTSVADCGVDIYNENVEVFIFEPSGETLSIQDTLQAIARPRKAQDLKVTIFKQQREGFKFNKKAAKSAILKFARKECKILNMMNEEYLSAGPYVARDNSYTDTARYCKFNYNTKQYEVSELLIHHQVELLEAQSKTPEQFFKELADQKHIRMTSTECILVQKSEEMAAVDTQAREKKKDIQQQALTLLDEIDDNTIFAAIYHSSKDISIRKSIIKAGYNITFNEAAQDLQQQQSELLKDKAALQVFTRFIRLKRRKIEPEKISDLLDQNRCPRRFGDLLTELDTLQRISNLDRLSGAEKRDTERILENKKTVQEALDGLESINKKIVDPSSVVKGLTADQITDIINKNREYPIQLTKAKAMQLFRILFEIESEDCWLSETEGEEKKSVRVYWATADKTQVTVF
jgi:hypothetical protein